MAKDAKGHGSNPRGKAKVSVTRPVGYTIHDIGPGGKKTLAASGVLAQGAGGQVVNAKDSTAQDRVAADALASGPKSASPPVHEAMQGDGHRAVAAPDVSGSPAWHGEYHDGTKWQRVKNQSGRPISYTTPEYARKGAVTQRHSEHDKKVRSFASRRYGSGPD